MGDWDVKIIDAWHRCSTLQRMLRNEALGSKEERTKYKYIPVRIHDVLQDSKIDQHQSNGRKEAKRKDEEKKKKKKKKNRKNASLAYVCGRYAPQP